MRPLGEQIVGAPCIAGKIVRIEALVLRRGEDFPAEHGVEESLLVPEMDIKHRLADACSRRDPVNSCPRQPVLGKFPSAASSSICWVSADVSWPWAVTPQQHFIRAPIIA